ncbi:MAG: ABC transporter ATP-binding protein [bacterium]
MLELIDAQLQPASPQRFDHQFAPGRITVVLGTNQSGKTNLCRLVAGLNTRARGRVRLNGLDLASTDPRQRPVSMVYQAFVNYPNLTVAQNIASPLLARRGAEALDKSAVAARVDELAHMLQIHPLRSRMPHELSGGQQQRLAIARALAKQAPVLLLDEPLVNLDFKLREALEVELRELLRQTDTVVIYTSSDPRDAFTLGDEVLLLAAGEKLQAGAPLDVYLRPDSLAAMQLMADPGVNVFVRQQKTCALRPEHLRTVTDAGADLIFDMQVSAFETNGSESFVHGEVEGRQWVMRCDGMLRITPGQHLKVCASDSDVVQF